jgi:hypothetical protein
MPVLPVLGFLDDVFSTLATRIRTHEKTVSRRSANLGIARASLITASFMTWFADATSP